MSKHTLSVLVENTPGILARIAALFSRRGFNIDSLAVGVTEHPDISRITIVVSVEELPLEQVTKQLNKLVNVLKIVELEPGAGRPARTRSGEGARRQRDALPDRRDRPALPRQDRGRLPGGRHHRGHRQQRQAGGHAQDAGAVRHQGAGPVRHDRHRARRPLHHRPVACAPWTGRA